MINVLAGNDLLKYEEVFKLGYTFCLNYLSLLKVTAEAEEEKMKEMK